MTAYKKYFFCSLSFLYLSCMALLTSANELLDWDTKEYELVFTEKTGWKGISGKETFTHLYKKPSETSQNWTLKIEVTNLPIAITLGNKTRWNPKSILETGNKKCSDWNIIQQNNKSILYERHNINCPGYLHQREIGRIVMGEWYLWWINYGIRNTALSEDAEKEIINKLKSAKVVAESK